MNVGILGGGISGVSLAYFLQKKHVACEVLEKETVPGGHCRSHVKDGFTYDQGGHILFSRNKPILNEMVSLLGENAQQLFRNNKIFFKGRYVKYPFENDLSGLGVKDNLECLFYYFFNAYPKPTNFKEWIYHTFGKGIAEKYLIPYNEKIWKTPAEELSMDWAGGRVPKPPAKDVLKSSLGISTEGYVHQLNFYYPKRGGFQSVFESFASKVPSITKEFEIKKIVRESDGWVVSNGTTQKRFSHLVSTMPIFNLVSCLEGVPQDVVEAVGHLRCNALIVTLIGVNRPHLSDKFAVYVPDRNIRFHRMYFGEYLGCVPEGKSSVVLEMTCRFGDETWHMASDVLIQETISNLERMEILKSSDVVTTDLKRIRYAYIVHDHAYQPNIQKVYTYFSSLNLFLCGRFSEFRYYNSDACVASASQLAERIVKQE